MSMVRSRKRTVKGDAAAGAPAGEGAAAGGAPGVAVGAAAAGAVPAPALPAQPASTVRPASAAWRNLEFTGECTARLYHGCVGRRPDHRDRPAPARAPTKRWPRRDHVRSFRHGWWGRAGRGAVPALARERAD